MSDAKYTPGPWSWEYHPDTHEPIALSAHGSDVLLATGDDRTSWAFVSEADARLIASAPDLLAALKFYVAICGNTAASVTRETAAAMHARATAAIAKAEPR